MTYYNTTNGSIAQEPKSVRLRDHTIAIGLKVKF